MNVHFLKKGSLKLLHFSNYCNIHPLYRHINIRMGSKPKCDVLVYPKNYEYPKKFIEVIKDNEIYLGSIHKDKPSIDLENKKYGCFRPIYGIAYLYNIRSLVYPNYNHITIKGIDDSIICKLKSLGESLNDLLDTAHLRSISYDWDYTLSFEENCKIILIGED